jgi:C-terminal peptidase prc
MTAWATHRGLGTGAALLLLLACPAVSRSAPAATPAPLLAEWDAADPVSPPKPAPTSAPNLSQLRARATAAEKAGDWEAAFSAYCELHLADRSSPAVRDKLNAALRRVQQLRRHRDPAFQQFVTGLPVADAVNLFAETTAKVPGMFADPARATPQHLWENGVEELDRALGSLAFRQAFLDTPAAAKVDAFRGSLRSFWVKRVVPDPREARAALKQLLAAAQDTFAVRVPAALAMEVVCGACTGLDEYTIFLTPSQTPEPAAHLPTLAECGLYLGFRGGALVVDGVVPGSWAAFHTPLRKGDRIAKVNGRAMTDPAALARALDAPVNASHELEFVVPAPDMLAVVRVPLVVPTVYGGKIVDSDNAIGYVRISEFQPATPREFADAVAALKLQGMRALLLDLRGNHGGSFVAGVDVARRLLPAGLIVTTQGQLDQVAGQVFSSDSGMTALDVPLVVLIDAETASAAEVVAAALRDNNRAVLVGMPSFGKGTIQYPLKLTAADGPDGMNPTRPKSGSVRVTIARLIAPRGTPINGVGITPHHIEPDPARQLDRAVERAIDLLNPGVPGSPVLPPSSY